jgi:hypothetical protein
MKPKYQIHTTALAALTVLALATTLAHAQYYNAPAGGWGYIYTGDLGAAGSGTTYFDSLDGTWNHSGTGNGNDGPGDSDNWDGSAIGGTLGAGNAPGGVETGTGGGVNYLRIQDPGNPTAYAVPNNRTIAFGHSLTANGFSDTFLNTGVTLSFRIRVPTDVLDDRTILGVTTPYPTTGDGYATFGNGLGALYLKNNANSVDGGVRPGAIGFGLGVANDNYPSSGSSNGPALYMNNLWTDTVNNQVDWGEQSTRTPYVNNALPIADATAWNEFYITIQANDSTPGNGTHTVRIWKNGELTYADFNVTAGNNNQDYQAIASMGMALAHSEGSGAMDVDYFAVKEGIYAPTLVPEPSAVSLAVLGLLALAAGSRRYRRN